MSKQNQEPRRPVAPASYTIEETRRLLRVGRATAYRRVEDGTWPVIRPSPRVLRIPGWWVEQQLRGA
jgi:hypothetical protein